ncbi:LamG-like jellyroll fold domain-containing protein, partial [Streptomyces tendae]
GAEVSERAKNEMNAYFSDLVGLRSDSTGEDVCDGPGRKLRLYVNGVQEAVVEDTGPAPATGPFIIGRASFDGQPRDFFPGAIRDVRAFDRALAPARIAHLV